MIQFLNIPAASIFKTQMFWAMENGTPATSRHTMCPVTSVSIMPLRRKGCCLSYHLFIQCVASKRHLKLFLSRETSTHLFLQWQS